MKGKAYSRLTESERKYLADVVNSYVDRHPSCLIYFRVNAQTIAFIKDDVIEAAFDDLKPWWCSCDSCRIISSAFKKIGLSIEGAS